MKESKSITIDVFRGKVQFDISKLKGSLIKNVDISIIIRTKDEDKKIRECLDKLLSQKCSKTFEIIIIDSGSNDNTLNYAKNYDVVIENLNLDKTLLEIETLIKEYEDKTI